MKTPSVATVIGLVTIPMWAVIFPLGGATRTCSPKYRQLLMLAVGTGFFLALALNVLGIIVSLKLKKHDRFTFSLSGFLLNGLQLCVVVLASIIGMVLNMIDYNG
jgi:hypothetical protein